MNFKRRKLQGLKTGVEALDRNLRGIHGITTIQGEPASCKSTLCLQIAHHVCAQGHPVLFLDRENGIQRMRLRILCQKFSLSQSQLFGMADAAMEEWQTYLNSIPLYIVNERIQEEEVFINHLKALYDVYKKPVLVVVDSLQAMPKVMPDERLNIQYWMEFFDTIKVKTEGRVYFLITCEKKRGAYEEARMDGGKGSNAIEYKSEVMLDIRRDPATGELILHCKKFRDGLSDFKVFFRKQLSDPQDERSFTYVLEESTSAGDGEF